MNEFYSPETITTTKDNIYLAIESIKSGLEFAKELLAEHDVNLGRQTVKNRRWAEYIEAEIEKMNNCLDRFSKIT